MVSEDLRSFCVDKHLLILSLTSEISKLNSKIVNNEQQIDRQTKRLESLDQELTDERKSNDELTN
jgi:cell division protein FtsL